MPPARLTMHCKAVRVPRGMAAATRSTYQDEPAADREYENLGEGP